MRLAACMNVFVRMCVYVCECIDICVCHERQMAASHISALKKTEEGKKSFLKLDCDA